MHAIIGWELELIAPKLCELIGMKYEERNDEEGYTSEWLLELDKWLAKSDLDSLGIWTDGDRMFGADAALFIGFYVHDENFDWVTEISTPMKKFKEICALNKIEFEEPEMHHRDDTGFGYACDHEFKIRPDYEKLRYLTNDRHCPVHPDSMYKCEGAHGPIDGAWANLSWINGMRSLSGLDPLAETSLPKQPNE